MQNKNFYITTPIYYPSGNPHMGHAYSSIIADIFARFKKMQGYNVFFLTGTDEHGLKIQKEAEKNNKDTKMFCDEVSKKFEDLTKILNLTNNDFIRTTETRHHRSVNEIWNRLIKSGDIYLGKYSGWYSVSDEAYYDEDEISEENGKKISKSSGSSVEWVEEESYFFKLSSWSKKLLDHYDKNPNFILPRSRANEVKNFVKKGLKDLSVSRTSFSWGIPVPQNKKHVIYVWLDALTNYLSALNFPDTNQKLYKDFWPASIHIIGKDILRFHAIYWPAFLMAAKIPLPERVFGHGWILSDKKKMSKSLGNILDPDSPETMDYRLLTSVVFTDPQAAVVGLTEKQAKSEGVSYISASYPFNDHGKSIIMEAMHGFVKLLCDPKSGEILGGACTGPMGGELIHEIVTAMAKRMTVGELAVIPHYHPTLAEIWTYPAEDLAEEVAM